ncbi:MAG: hypothetical protein JNM09_23045 [Blastocatellia bacterium]|nr:hypothetical protein [Blastocatellia bacterium]
MIATSLANQAKDLRRILILLAVYVIAAHFTLSASVVADPDIWWHWRTGQWIAEHHQVPLTDPFSYGGAGKPWLAYSWLFELLILWLYRWSGLSSIFVYKIPVVLGILWSVLALLRRLGQSFLAAIGLMSLFLLAITPLLTPRPWLLTILLFSLELHILLHFRQSGSNRCLLWLLPLFALWANIHIQFIYGFVPLALVVTEPVIEEFLRRPFSRRWGRTALQFRAWLILPFCFAATLVTPYHLRVYKPVLEYTQQTEVFKHVLELQSMNFRHPAHWIALGLTLWAAYCLGRQSERRAFPVLFLLASAALSFRANRDVWVVALASITIIALSRPTVEVSTWQGITNTRLFAVFLLGCICATLIAKRYDIGEISLQKEVEKTYPVAAARVVEERGYPGPLYNHFNWGGYFIWRLPQLPVSMDGRTNLYGEERIQRSLDSWNGKPGWARDAELNAAATVIADVNMPLCSLLRLDQRFDLVYEDSVAAVFRKRAQP